MWIVDFGVDWSEGEAALHEVPLTHVLQQIEPEHDNTK
jgi:hypothetical protein